MATSPVIEWRNATTPFAVVSSVAMTGSGYGGAIPVNTSSSVVTLRIYNNFAAATGVADATNCTLASYDDTSHQGLALTQPNIYQYLTVMVTDYNGTTTGGDTFFYQIGGWLKHPLPVNSATLSGTGANYVTVQLQVAIPSSATQGAYTQGVWLEYSSTA